MALYCIGDIQGCGGAFERLLAHIGFSPSRDTVYLLGDLVNRGPDSAAVLRRCMALDGAVRPLLGNHDLHLLATAHGARKPSRRDGMRRGIGGAQGVRGTGIVVAHGFPPRVLDAACILLSVAGRVRTRRRRRIVRPLRDRCGCSFSTDLRCRRSAGGTWRPLQRIVQVRSVAAVDSVVVIGSAGAPLSARRRAT